MLTQEFIRKKRDGGELTSAEIGELIGGLVDGSVSEAQAAAFAMAVFFRGMTPDEGAALTLAMRDSGRVLGWEDLDLPGPTLDKHSTGGVGDKVSLILAPMVAACGGYVPMISGRGLGHTGGTLDKLDSIPGYCSQPDADTFRRTVVQAGCAIIGQTADLAPADRRLYAIRDVTATVESVPLITASILSKKLAAGLNGLVMDVKTGSGAFAADLEMARDLAHSIVSVAGSAGLPCTALLTDMNQVLGRNAGNALEVRESVDYLRGDARDPRLHEVVLALGAEMLLVGKLFSDRDSARGALVAALDSGAAAERLARMVSALGGPTDVLERADALLPSAPVVGPVHAPEAGFVVEIDTRRHGIAVVELGGGRQKATDAIDHSVGLSSVRGIGEHTDSDTPLAVVHAADDESWQTAAQSVIAAMRVGPEPSDSRPVFVERMEAP